MLLLIQCTWFIIAKTWKQPKCPLMDEWIMSYTHTHTEYYSTIKKNEILPFVKPQADLEGTTELREVSQRKANSV